METDNGSGSGFVISKSGYLFTCYHVVKDTNEIFVRLVLRSGKREVYKAEIIIKNEDEDYAILKVLDCTGLCFYEIEEDYSQIKTGDDVAVWGYPYGADLNEKVMELEPSLTKGYISSKNKIHGKDCFYLDIHSSPGNSGGPVFSLSTNKVIGYLCGSYGSDRSNLIYIKTMEHFLSTLK